MKRNIGIIFWVLISAISAPGIAFDRVSELEACRTVSECLQNTIEANNKLVAENEKLMQGNLALKKKIGELQNKYSSLEKRLEWIVVPLDDKNQFDEKCEYRVILKLDDSRFVYKEGTFYPSIVTPGHLVIIGGFEDPPISVYAHHFVIDCHQKYRTHRMGGNVLKLEKRCAV